MEKYLTITIDGHELRVPVGHPEAWYKVTSQTDSYQRHDMTCRAFAFFMLKAVRVPKTNRQDYQIYFDYAMDWADVGKL